MRVEQMKQIVRWGNRLCLFLTVSGAGITMVVAAQRQEWPLMFWAFMTAYWCARWFFATEEPT